MSARVIAELREAMRGERAGTDFRMPVEDARELIAAWDKVERVIAAWKNPGLRPDYHRKAQVALSRTWPKLANALRALAAEDSRG